MAPHASLSIGNDGVAVITLTNPPVNALHPDLIHSLFDAARKAQASQDVKAIVVTGANGRFSAGFDIAQFQKSSGGGGVDMSINNSFRELLEAGRKPTVAAVSGLALGGGLETAMACNARVASPDFPQENTTITAGVSHAGIHQDPKEELRKQYRIDKGCSSSAFEGPDFQTCAGTQLGLPELSLGVIPGFGGTQRLPRLVGLQQAVQMMLTSKPIKEKAALKAGLVDAVVPAEKLLEAAKALALEIANGTQPRNLSLYRTDKIETFGEAIPILEFAAAETRKRAPHLTHPHLCLEAIKYGIEHGGLAGLRKEVENFQKAASLDTHKALVHIFFAQRSTKKVKGITDAGLKARPVKTLAVLGGGLMGSGICTAGLQAGMNVILKEVNEKFLEAGVQRVRANFSSQVKKGKLTEEKLEALMKKLHGTVTYDKFKSVDMVIEAAVENIPIKQQIFADLEKACSAECILSSNTSTIDISLVGQKTSAADRVVGAHFFSPAHIMPLLEIVRTTETSKQVVLDTIEFGAKIKKTPVVVGNCTGFAVNRVFFPYTQAACLLVDIGLDPYMIDKVIAMGFGMPMGPFRLSDLVGADIGMHVAQNFAEDFSERIYPTSLIQLLNDGKQLGEKTGSGFYKFDKKRKASPNPELATIVAQSRKNAGLIKAGDKPPKMSPQDIIEFIFFPVVNEGCRVIAEGIVDKPADLDVATVLSMGFPPYRGGLIKWADLIGAQHVASRLEGWAEQFSGAGIAGFFKPCKYLADAAASGSQLGSGIKQSKL